MLVALQIRGRWDGTRYVFERPSVSKLYNGPMAYALGGGGGGTTEEFTPTGPWSQQTPYITGLFGEASRLYNNGAPQYYPGSTVADTNPNLAASQGNITNATNQSAQQMQDQMLRTSQNAQRSTLAGGVGMGQIMPYNTAVNQLLQSSINNPTQSVAGSALPAFYGGLQQAQSAAAPVSTPQTQFGQVNANPALMSSLYSNGMNPYTGDIVNAALRSQNQQFARNVVPQISTQANMAGQLGGTRHGIAEGMAADQHQIMQKDLIAQLFGQAFDTGSQERLAALGLAGQGQQANAQFGLGAQSLAEQQRQATMQSGLGQSQLVGNMLGQGQQLGNQAAGTAGQLSGNMITQGSGQNLQSQIQNTALLPGLNQAMNSSLGMGNQVGLQQQSQDQAQRDAAVERWFYEQYAPMNMLTQYQNWVTGPYGASADPYGGVSTAGNYVPQNYQPAIGPGALPYSGVNPYGTSNPTQDYLNQLIYSPRGITRYPGQ
jgi:hypothetical protein